MAAYERGGRAFALNRIVGGTNNWRLRAKMADDSFFSNAVDWSFGGPGVQLLGWCLRAEGGCWCASADTQRHWRLCMSYSGEVCKLDAMHGTHPNQGLVAPGPGFAYPVGSKLAPTAPARMAMSHVLVLLLLLLLLPLQASCPSWRQAASTPQQPLCRRATWARCPMPMRQPWGPTLAVLT